VKIISINIIASLISLMFVHGSATAASVKAAANPNNLVSIACDIDNPDSQGEQRVKSFSVNRGVPNPNSDNCSDAVVSYLKEGYKIKTTLSSGTGRLIYILVK
jgi:hypothetical protein